MFVTSLLYAVVCGALLWNAAGRTKRAAIDELTRWVIRTTGGGGPAKAHADQLEAIVRQMDAMRDGAFAQFSQQPIVQALSLAASGAGGIAVLEYLPLLGL